MGDAIASSISGVDFTCDDAGSRCKTKSSGWDSGLQLGVGLEVGFIVSRPRCKTRSQQRITEAEKVPHHPEYCKALHGGNALESYPDD